MSTADDLDQRLRRLEDRAELQDLVVRYFVAIDDQDYDAVAGCFAAEAEFAGGYGRDDVVEILRADRSTMGPTIHSPDYTSFAFEGDDRASGVVGAHCELSRGGQTLFGAMRYADEYVRELGAWRILRREIRLFHLGPWSEVGTSLTSELRVRWPGQEPTTADLPQVESHAGNHASG